MVLAVGASARPTRFDKVGCMNMSAHSVRWGAAVLAVGLLAGCLTLPGREAEPDPLAELEPLLKAQPRFSPGDFYRFDNPEAVWRVVEADADTVRWEMEPGRGQLTYQHPLFPPLEWWAEGQGNGRRLISNLDGEVFPIAVGRRMRFKSTVSADTPPHAWEYDWSCEVLREEPVTIGLGRFDTFVVQCGRVQPDEYLFWYAPQAGFYVRYRVTRFGQPPVARELTGFRNAHLAGLSEELAALQEAGPVGAALAASEPMPAAARLTPVDDGRAAGAAPDSTAQAGAGGGETVPPVNAPPPRGPIAMPPPIEVGERPLAPATTVAAAPARPPSPVREGAADRAATGPVVVHLASYRDRANAERGWRQLVRGNEDVLGGLAPDIRQADLGERGMFFRLHAGPLETASAAETLCRTLNARGAYCQVVR